MKGRRWERANIWIAQWRQYKAGKRIYDRHKITSHEYTGSPFHKDMTWYNKAYSEQFEITTSIVDDIIEKLDKVKPPDERTMSAYFWGYVKKIEAEVFRQVIEKTREMFMSARENAMDEMEVSVPFTAAEDNLLRQITADIFTNVNDSMRAVYDTARMRFINTMNLPPDERRLEIEAIIDAIISRATTTFRINMASYYNTIKNEYYKIAEQLGEKHLYIWVNPMDDRTTPICREIVERSAKGLTIDEMKALIREVAMKYNSKTDLDKTPFYPHFGCRSTLKIKD
ncbi:MAG: hypothetical protein QW533_07155 [Thermoplasmata archaeon]